MTQLLLPFLRIVFTLFPSWDFDDLRRITYPASTRPRKAQAGGNDVTANMRLLSSVASSVPATTKVLMSNFTHFPCKTWLDFFCIIFLTKNEALFSLKKASTFRPQTSLCDGNLIRKIVHGYFTDRVWRNLTQGIRKNERTDKVHCRVLFAPKNQTKKFE